MTENLDANMARRLDAATRELRAFSPPADLPARILGELERRGAPRSRSAGIRWWSWSALGMAGAALAAWLLVSSLSASLLEQDIDDGTESTAADGFVSLADNDMWRQAAQADAGRVWLVPAEVSRARLAALGLPYDPARAGERVGAQLLMQGSGDVLAVRIVQTR